MKSIIPDIFNSKTEKVFLELPNYAYSHSSSTEDKTSSFFIGRKNLIERLIHIIRSSTSKTGVYLVTGNRGVGKTSLVNEVIKNTSLQKDKNKELYFPLLLMLFFVLVMQYSGNHFPNIISSSIFLIILLIANITLFSFIAYYSFVRKRTKQYEKGNFWNALLRFLKGGLKDLLYLPYNSNPILSTRNTVKFTFLLNLFQLLAILTNIVHTHISYFSSFTVFRIFIIYLGTMAGIVFTLSFNKFLIDQYRKEKQKKELNLKIYFDNYINRLFSVFFVIAFILSLFCLIGSYFSFFMLFFVIAIILNLIKNLIFVLDTFDESLIKQIGKGLNYTFIIPLREVKNWVDNYIKNNNRIYVKINFGHDVLHERDILRLITRTLTTEYRYFRCSIMHSFYRRILILAVIILATHLFYHNIYSKFIKKENDYIELLSQLENKILISGNTIFARDIIYSQDHTHSRFCIKYMIFQFKTYISKAEHTINQICFYFRNVPDYFWVNNNDREPINYISPAYYDVDYAWWFIFFVFSLLVDILLRSGLFTTHYTIKRKLKQLNESITYNVEMEFAARNPNLGGIGKRKVRLIADSREIEKELQDILDNVQQIPMYMARPEFVFVFDELDKVSPEVSQNTATQEGETKEALFASNSTRERQAIILKLLSNMKFFLTNANAKFIFIAGREMYDMHLADIADRNNYFGSIFNNVLFVPSFLTDSQLTSHDYNITLLVEEFVCYHLIPENYPATKYNLRSYRQYLEDVIYCKIGEENGIKEKIEKKINMFQENDEEQKKYIRVLSQILSNEQKIQKIIAVLQQFILYLSQTSKGAPKKMIQVFETFIQNFEIDYFKKRDRKLVVKLYSNSRFFLTFDYYDQFTVGMTSYLVSPMIYLLGDTNIQQHSDKLLISTLHFVDYMLKFHNQNFTWRQLDISPEVIENGHSPELKSIINDVITLFEQTHLTKPIISLFDFKFDALLSQEIFFIAKMFEPFSAQFDFSLDESLALKQYYVNLLERKRLEYKEFKNYGANFVSSISSLQIVLGDLYLLDDELEEAALYYKDGEHLLRKLLNKDKKHENLEHFYLFIRNQLKLAYLYEKRKQPEFAYLVYGELASYLIKVRDIDLEKMGISFRNKSKDGNEEYIMVRKTDEGKQDPRYEKYVETKQYGENENVAKIEYENVRDMTFKQLTPKTQQIMYKNMTFEGLQLMYLPLLAKLQILEKRYYIGILKSDIELIDKEFNFLIRTINHKDIKILVADFYTQMGDILYYKNKVFSEDNIGQKEKGKNEYKIDISYHPCYYYKKALIGLILEVKKDNGKMEQENEQDFNSKSILNILKDKDKDGNGNKAEFIYNKTSAKYCAVMARVLSNLGDVYFSAKEEMCKGCKFYKAKKGICESCVLNDVKKVEYECNCGFSKEKQPHDGFWYNWHKFINSELTLEDFLTKFDDLNHIELALFLYSLSQKFYKKAGYHKQAAYQTTKILRSFIYCTELHEKEYEKLKNKINEFVNSNGEKIVENGIRSLYIAYDGLNMLKILKRKEIFNGQDAKLRYTQMDSEVQRMNLVYQELKLKLIENENTDIVKSIYKLYITSPYQINYSVSVRVYQLRLKAILNNKVYEIIMKDCDIDENIDTNVASIFCKLIDSNWSGSNTEKIFEGMNGIQLLINNKENKDKKFFTVLEWLIADSIFCYIDILRLIKTSGDSNIFNHGFFAATYSKLSKWTFLYEILKNEFYEVLKGANIQTHIDEYLEQLIEKDYKQQISAHYYRGQALLHYYKSIEMHSGGRAYFNLLEQMYFIKGDYDDILSHFNVAAERFLINNTNIYSKNIDSLTNRDKESILYKPEKYFEEP